MTQQFDRRAALGLLLATPLLGACGAAPAASPDPVASPAPPERATAAAARLAELERTHDVRLGVFARSLASGATVVHRENERFAMCSTFKPLAAGALLRAHPLRTGFFDRLIRFTSDDLVEYSPVTETRVGTGMTVAELCEAAITRSDNTAGNQLLELLGGPRAVTGFARSIGDSVTRLDRWETELNSALRGDPRDTTTPAAIGTSYRALVTGDALGAAERRRFTDWLLANTTGDDRIRAGLPQGWTVGDKTGSGSFGTANDVAVAWTDTGTPIVIAVLSDASTEDAEAQDAPIAAAARVVAAELG
ncbi:class A beta-lactamase [Qaidamihabitans albus]|uniref:class A beta-lactamase n=1 Tax=Qaidamihabitans albus TaxID=2795733 RepID=UPI0018F1A145|nr:class A beta-lactamase [Qaidamihabitans albus]